MCEGSSSPVIGWFGEERVKEGAVVKRCSRERYRKAGDWQPVPGGLPSRPARLR